MEDSIDAYDLVPLYAKRNLNSIYEPIFVEHDEPFFVRFLSTNFRLTMSIEQRVYRECLFKHRHHFY